MAKNRTIKTSMDEKGLVQAQEFVQEALDKRRFSKGVASEVKPLSEALFHEIKTQSSDEDDELELSYVSKLGHTDIGITFPGERFTLPEGDTADNPNAKAIDEYSDRVSCSYDSGYNDVQISAGRSALSPVLPSIVAIVAAAVVAFVLSFAVDDGTRQMLVKECIAPLEKLFTNAMLMIGAPMTLFSLLKNVTDAFLVAGRHSESRRLFITSVASSVVVVALALVMGFVFAQWILSATGVTERVDIGFAGWSLASAVDQIIPSSIVQPFETISPIPMIVVALLMVGALKSTGNSFKLLKPAIDACYDLFSGILQIVMTAFPPAVFLLFLEVLLSEDGFAGFVEIFFIGAIVFVCTIPLLILYGLRLRARGVNVREFARKLGPLLKENFAIGSVIDAVPYNTRYCVKHFGFSRDRLQKELPVLSQVSLDGNCFILMLLATIYIFVANCEVSWFHIAVIAGIVIFLSFGAPNQPGSILIGMLVILTYLNSNTAIALALCFELFCGGLQNLLNVISSVVMVTEDEYAERNRKRNRESQASER